MRYDLCFGLAVLGLAARSQVVDAGEDSRSFSAEARQRDGVAIATNDTTESRALIHSVTKSGRVRGRFDYSPKVA